jgi:hypothetical protein
MALGSSSCGDSRFAIFYREKQAVVQVLAIAHGHRRPGHWKDRLWPSADFHDEEKT